MARVAGAMDANLRHDATSQTLPCLTMGPCDRYVCCGPKVLYYGNKERGLMQEISPLWIGVEIVGMIVHGHFALIRSTPFPLFNASRFFFFLYSFLLTSVHGRKWFWIVILQLPLKKNNYPLSDKALWTILASYFLLRYLSLFTSISKIS